jgi:hypothetical protein
LLYIFGVEREKMYKDYIGSNVTIIVASRGEYLLDYVGVLLDENDNNITLSNVNISFIQSNIQKNMFGGSISQIKENVESVCINKNYIISCNK